MYDDLFDRYGEPITYRDWHFLRMFPAYKRVAADELVLDDIVYVSTVWLGMDHGFRPYTTKLIFETMVFGGEFDQEMWRYTTEEEALDGHAQVVKALSTPPENRQVQ